MKKYWLLFKISLAQDFAYRMNFIMWRVRNVIQVLITFFLWNSVFQNPSTVLFGYDRQKILTYVFGIILIRSLVFSARSVDVPQEISDGSLTNYLIRPIRYFKYWVTRDIANKLLNFGFSIFEFLVLLFIFRPPVYFQSDLFLLSAFIVSLVLANYLIFVLRFLITSLTFWVPELSWGGQFLFMVIITEFLSGSVFPLDIFPSSFQNIFYLTPFPYLVFFPLQVYLGKIAVGQIIWGMVISLAWSFGLTLILKRVWNKGISLYEAVGK